MSESKDRAALRIALDAIRNLRMFTTHDMSRNDAEGAVRVAKAALAQPDPDKQLANAARSAIEHCDRGDSYNAREALRVALAAYEATK